MPQRNIVTFEQLMGFEETDDIQQVEELEANDGIQQVEELGENDGIQQVEELKENHHEVEIKEKKLPMGQCKSGRFWKTPKNRFKTIVKTRGLKFSVDQRRKIQDEIKKAKQLTRDALDARNKEKEEHRQRRIANLKKREENAKKAEIVQVIKNPSKIKKKHLRMIQKRDTLPMSKNKAP